jgi:hypothetical protein
MPEEISYIEFIILWAISSTTDQSVEALQLKAKEGPIPLPYEDMNEVVETVGSFFDCPVDLDRSTCLVDVGELAQGIRKCIA